MPKIAKKLPMDKMLDVQRARIRNLVAESGGQQRLAEALGVTQAAVSKWVVQGFVPLHRAVEIESTFGVPRTSLANPRIVQMLAPVEFDAA